MGGFDHSATPVIGRVYRLGAACNSSSRGRLVVVDAACAEGFRCHYADIGMTCYVPAKALEHVEDQPSTMPIADAIQALGEATQRAIAAESRLAIMTDLLREARDAIESIEDEPLSDLLELHSGYAHADDLVSRIDAAINQAEIGDDES